MAITFILPFAAFSDNAQSENANLLEGMTETGNRLNGKRFSESISKNEAADWVCSLNK